MDGLNFKTTGNVLENYFHQDSYGSFIPNRDMLQLDRVSERFRKQLNAKTGLYRRLAEIYERTDVQFTNNPLGNTPVIGAGYKEFGPRPLNVKREGRISFIEGKNPDIEGRLKARENRIEGIQLNLMNSLNALKPAEEDKRNLLLWQIEQDQVMTGGGFDNNKVGQVHKAALHFISDSSEQIDYEDKDLSKVIVEGCAWIKDLLIQDGLILGSLEPKGASVVRAEQDTDGMFGWPVYAKGNDELTKDIAKRLLIESGVDVSSYVGKIVVDSTTKVTYKFRVIDAIGKILDSKVFSPTDLMSLVTLLARIQKHGWKKEDDGFIAKDGKTRAVYPNSAIAAVVEAMIAASFNDECKEKKVKILPSLQDKPTRIDIIRKMIMDAFQNEYDYLAADWSKYDASVKGCILATVIQLVVKPFFRSEYYHWVDMMTYILTFKYLILDKSLSALNPEELELANQASEHVLEKNFYIYGLTDGLISGAKFTHVGGSLYGHATIHYGIGRLLGFKPIKGPQAGDDTLMGVPKSIISIDSVEDTYNPIIKMAERFGLKANASKQIWQQSEGEVAKVFLQDSYHMNLNIWGVGSIYRPLSAIFTAEREKNLSVAEQLMAEIARLNQGADSPFASGGVEWFFHYEQWLGWLFKNYGVSGFKVLIKTIGKSPKEIAKSIDVGSFTFGVNMEDFESGNLPILPVMVDVSTHMTFDNVKEALFDFSDTNSILENSGVEDDLHLSDDTIE